MFKDIKMMMGYSKITISGQICTGKTTLFWALQEYLNWPVFSTSQFFRDYSRTHNLKLDKAEEQNRDLTIKTDQRVKELLKKYDEIIIEGWMSGIMAQGIRKVLKILLICDGKTRIKRYSQREKVTFKEAEKRLEKRENNWLEKMREIYKNINVLDYCHYDIVIDTSDKNPSQILKTVLTRLKNCTKK